MSLPRLDVAFDMDTLNSTFGPSSSRSTWVLGTVTEPWPG